MLFGEGQCFLIGVNCCATKDVDSNRDVNIRRVCGFIFSAVDVISSADNITI